MGVFSDGGVFMLQRIRALAIDGRVLSAVHSPCAGH